MMLPAFWRSGSDGARTCGAATGALQVTTENGAEQCRIPAASGAIIYTSANGEIHRQAGPAAPNTLWLAGVKSSQMQSDSRGNVAAWRWELELKSERKEPRLRPRSRLNPFLQPQPPNENNIFQFPNAAAIAGRLRYLHRSGAVDAHGVPGRRQHRHRQSSPPAHQNRRSTASAAARIVFHQFARRRLLRHKMKSAPPMPLMEMIQRSLRCFVLGLSGWCR